MQILIIVTLIVATANLVTLLIIGRRILFYSSKDFENFTDFQYKNLTLRVFKVEFSQRAYSEDITDNKILDVGRLNETYEWILFES